MHLTMAMRNRDDLARLLAAQQDPSSPDYHRWLTPDSFTARFGPTAADLARVSRWLKRKGFTVNSADASTREIAFTGTVAQAQNAFGVKIAASTDGRLYSNLADPTVPVELASAVESIHGLDNLLHSAPMVHAVSKPSSIVNNSMPAFGPPDIYTFYDETPLLNATPAIDGSGNGCIAVVEDSNIDEPAADAFNTQFGLPALTGANFNIALVDRSDPGQNSDEDETMVDVSYSHALAPGSSIRIYLGDQKHAKSSAILDAIHAAVTEKSSPCSAISISFSFCGGSKNFYKTQNGFFAQAAAQGQSVFIATGDTGAAGLKLGAHGNCVTGSSRNVNEIGASPNVTAIGGTEFSPTYSGGSDVGSVSESVWNDGDGAGGGGESKVFKKPAFQNGLFTQDKKRDVPDISFGASPGSPGFFYGTPRRSRRTGRRMLHRRHQHRRPRMGRHQPANLASERRPGRQSEHANLQARRGSERRDDRNPRRNLRQHQLQPRPRLLRTPGLRQSQRLGHRGHGPLRPRVSGPVDSTIAHSASFDAQGPTPENRDGAMRVT